MKKYLALLSIVLTISTPIFAMSEAYTGSNNQAVPTLAPMLKKVLPSVVNISTQGTVSSQQNPLMNDLLLKRFFNIPQQQRPQQRQTRSIGSGVIVDAKNGYILTNNHVIAKADTIFVTLHNKKKLEAKLIGTDTETDIAVLQIKADELIDIPLANSDELQVGDFAVAIGNPFGLSHTVTSGMVSALGRTNLGIEGYENFIQTDASINPGNSGGALIDLHGHLIGINSAIIAPAGGNVGIGFSIPINMVKKIMVQLLEHGEIKRGLLGVQIQDLSSDLADAMNLKDTNGALVARVTPGSTAEKVGIQSGDVIAIINDKKITDASNLRTTIGLIRVGDKVKIQLLRNKKMITLTTHIGQTAKQEKNAYQTNAPDLLKGATLQALSQHQSYQGITRGLVITHLQHNSPAARFRLLEGDIILAVNKMPVSTLSDLEKAARGSNRQLLLHIQRGQRYLYLVIK